MNGCLRMQGWPAVQVVKADQSVDQKPLVFSSPLPGLQHVFQAFASVAGLSTDIRTAGQSTPISQLGVGRRRGGSDDTNFEVRT